MLHHDQESGKLPMRQCGQTVFLWLIIVSVLAVPMALPAKAQKPTSGVSSPTPTIVPYLVYLGTEVDGTETASNYKVFCDSGDNDLYVAVEITYQDGAKQLRTERCDEKFSVSGVPLLVRIVGVSSAPNIVHRVWLAAVMMK